MDATLAVMEMTMRKLMSVLSLAAALVVPQSINAEGFDLVSLPSIESITATTDVRPFLAPGVPRELKIAVLRRVWVTDPRIRDFRGLQENGWDFSDPRGIPGFDPFEPSEIASSFAARVLAEIGGENATDRSR
jgi:hypothetical protein